MAPQAKIWVLRCKNPFRNRIFELQTRENFRLRRYFFEKKIAARSSISVPCELQISQHLVQQDVNHKSLCERPNVEKEQKKYKEIQPINQFRLARLMQPIDLHVNWM